MARSRLTESPVFKLPRLLFLIVTAITSAVNPSGWRETTVRQTPLTAMLSPTDVPASTFLALTAIVPDMPCIDKEQTVPFSSTIPVNISRILSSVYIPAGYLHLCGSHSQAAAQLLQTAWRRPALPQESCRFLQISSAREKL